MRRKLLIACLIVLLLIGLAYFFTGFLVYRRIANVKGSCDRHLANRPDNFQNISGWAKWPPNFKDYFMPKYSDVRFLSRQEGLTIAGWYVEGEPSAPVIIVVDGLGGCRYAQAALLPAGMLWNSGFNVLIIDLRDTGDSDFEDGYSAIANEEYLDALGAWDWLIAKKNFTPNRIGMFGNSLGAVTVLYAFEHEPRLAAIFLNSPFANLSKIMKEELQRNRFPTFLAPAAVFAARIVNGDNILAHNPVSALRSADKRPVFILHSRDDERIGVHHSQQLESVAKDDHLNVTTWYVESAAHGQAPTVYPKKFQAKISQFFRQKLCVSQ